MFTQTLMGNQVWCHGDVEIVIRPDMGTVKFHSTVPCEYHLTSKQAVSFKLWVYDLFCQKPLVKQHPYTVISRSEGLHSPDVVRVKWFFMENPPDKGKANVLSTCNSSHTGSGIFLHSSQYAHFRRGVRTDDWWLITAFRDRTPVEQRSRFAQSLLKFGE
jgi:hypothetical protein